ncbi:Uncharacterised protein [Clostridium putrefaciens]|uniref:Uncharacterized protein n=1 Tax=Clostridium putrefaciens TaxID=99675 RepID=A0A381J446_9CLOT|nr:hypothetical protein [Clostridium putrefaciens]SUY45436.1 Uncharacterised protein [Clostridium putrefaciens]
MKSIEIFNFFSTSMLIVLGLAFINWKTFFVPKKESNFITISISMCKIAIMFFIISLNYSLFYDKVSYIFVLLHMCKIICFMVILVSLCKVIMFKHLIIYDNDVILKRHINKLYVENNKLIINTNNKILHIDIDSTLDKRLLKDLSCNGLKGI